MAKITKLHHLHTVLVPNIGNFVPIENNPVTTKKNPGTVEEQTRASRGPADDAGLGGAVAITGES